MTRLQAFQTKYPKYKRVLSPQDRERIQLEKEAKRIADHSYWNGNGRYQNIYDLLYSQVPFMGSAEDKHIEAIRCVSAIAYDIYNNGGCNLVGQQHHEEDDYYILDLSWGNYEDEFKFIEDYLKDEERPYRDANNTELGMLVLDCTNWGGWNNNDLVKLERIINRVIRKAYESGITRRIEQRDDTLA